MRSLIQHEFTHSDQSFHFFSVTIESHRFCNRVQDAYTLRCCPQVHGIVHDTIDFVRGRFFSPIISLLNAIINNCLLQASLRRR